MTEDGSGVSRGFVKAGGHRLEYTWHGPPPEEASTLVLLHEGLGCIDMWRDFPAAVAERTGCGTLVYSRWGYGRSESLESPRPARFMHDEALVTLPELLAALGVRRPILVGHSDGASIALIYAGAGAGPVRGLILEAPHVFVEELSIRSITAARTAFETTDLARRLERYHGRNTQGAFRGWNDVWLAAGFRDWNIEEYIPGVAVPMLLIQGEADEYGTRAQIEAIARQASVVVETRRLANCGHTPHRDRRDDVLDAMVDFVRHRLGEPRRGERAPMTDPAARPLVIRAAQRLDFDDVWEIFHAVVGAGDTYAFPPDSTPDDARRAWMSDDVETFVAMLEDRAVGTYILKANQPGLGDHVANAGFMVAPDRRGDGIGRAMAVHALETARSRGYVAMQFNLVVSTNAGAIALWRSLGFSIVGTLPKVFRHRRDGLVDAYVMHRFLD